MSVQKAVALLSLKDDDLEEASAKLLSVVSKVKSVRLEIASFCQDISSVMQDASEETQDYLASVLTDLCVDKEAVAMIVQNEAHLSLIGVANLLVSSESIGRS